MKRYMKRKSIVKVLSICLALSIFAAVANDALIIKAENGNIPSLQYDIQMQDYATPQGVEFSNSNRASAVAAYETGGRDFAYVGSSNGFTIFDITDPSEISIVQEISGDIIKTAISSKGVLVKDGRLIVANTKTNKIEFYQIATDGKIGSPYKSIDGTSMSKLETLDNYLFIAQNSNKGVEVYDLSDIADGESIVCLGNRASSVQANNFTVAKISQNQYRIFLIDRVSADIRQFVIFDVDMTGGGFAFTELYNKVPTEFTFPNPSQTQVFYLGDNVLVLGCGTVNDNGKDQIMVDVSNPGQPTEITTYSGRVQTYKYLGDGHYLAGTPDKSLGIYVFADGARAQIGETYAIPGGQVYEVAEHKGNLLIANSSQFSVWSYKTEARIFDSLDWIEETFILKGQIQGLRAGDIVNAYVFGESHFVDEFDINGCFELPLHYLPENGEYPVVLSVNRDGTPFVAVEKTINVNICPQLSFLDILLNDDEITFEIQNTYNEPLNSAIIFVASYGDNKLLDYGYIPLNNMPSKGKTVKTVSVNLQEKEYLKIFAINALEECRLVSDILVIPSTAQDGVNNDIDINLNPQQDKIDIIVNVNPAALDVTVSAANWLQVKSKTVLLVSDAENNLDELLFINAFETDENGRGSVKFKLTGNAQEGAQYNVCAAMGNNNWKSTTAKFSYYTAETISAALDKLYTQSDTLSIINHEIYQGVFQLDTSEQSAFGQLNNYHKEAVLLKLRSERFADVSQVVRVFNTEISRQNILQLINGITSNYHDIGALIEQNHHLLLINIDSFYSMLSEGQKDEFYQNWLSGKNFADVGLLESAFQEGEKVVYARYMQHGFVVDNSIIETHGHNLGLSLDIIAKYSALNREGKITVIKGFVKSNITSAAEIISAFDAAVESYKNSDDKPARQTAGGGGRGSGFSVDALTAAETAPASIDNAEVDMDFDWQSSPPLRDVNKSQWYYTAVTNLYKRKIVEGVTDGVFAPEQSVTREEFIKMLVLSFNILDEGAVTDFIDTSPNRWHYIYIATGERFGITSGIDRERFGVGQPITREEMAVMVWRTLKILDSDVLKKGEGAVQLFDDEPQISDFAHTGVAEVAKAGIINGYGDGNFYPQQVCTRAMAAQVIYNIINE
ncbi:MAG: S-layer homology domain-containing protein [Firmicutes bacterium]|nr:S-layer homology domain-containing protein [Bacillota bacterium]